MVCPHTAIQDYSTDDAIQAATWARELNPSLFMMLRTWLSTVRSDMNKRAPICIVAETLQNGSDLLGT